MQHLEQLIIDRHLFLEPVKLKRALSLFDLIENNRAYLKTWLGWLNTTTRPEHTEDFIRRSELLRLGGMGINIAIIYNQELVGMISLHDVNREHRKANIGYWLGKGFQGLGIMSKAVKELIRYGFQDLNLNRLEIRCASGNVKSRAIPIRLGFQEEGLIRDSEWLYDHFVDHIVYGKLVKDFKPD